MLKLNFILILVSVLFAVMGILVYFFGLSPWWYVLLGVILIVFTAFGSFRIRMSFYFDVVCRIKSDKNIILTFDDGPDETVTPNVLDVLRRNNVRAVFFVIGSQAEKFPALVKQAFDDGHIIGNHSYCHKNMFGFYSSQKVAADIKKSAGVIKNIIGLAPVFFRPPFGVTNPNIKTALKKLNLLPIGWSLRSLDTVSTEKEKIDIRLAKVKPGDIVLFHDRIAGIELVIDQFIKSCRKQNLGFARLDEALKTNAYE
ncbi:MAG TPA: polysaccharide deacetylase family protein [Bacteroidales bacterium]|nr:polysaccharide deacetylase family protein [Bacteroidales bacterium]